MHFVYFFFLCILDSIRRANWLQCARLNPLILACAILHIASPSSNQARCGGTRIFLMLLERCVCVACSSFNSFRFLSSDHSHSSIIRFFFLFWNPPASTGEERKKNSLKSTQHTLFCSLLHYAHIRWLFSFCVWLFSSFIARCTAIFNRLYVIFLLLLLFCSLLGSVLNSSLCVRIFSWA